MNKSGLKKFATNIRIELLSLVKTKVDYFLKLDISNFPIEFKSYESSIITPPTKYHKNQAA